MAQVVGQGALVPALAKGLTVERLNRASHIATLALSFLALSTLVVTLSAAFLSGHAPKPEADEGTGAHIFQLSIAALALATLVFMATADWDRPWRPIRKLIVPACAVVIAFGLLYYFEHVLTAG